jgi:hydrogenase maturation protein HypF
MAIPNPIDTTASLLKEGHILAIKGLGGFHLAADAKNDETVARLRKRKNREEKPFAIMSYGLASVCQYAHVGPEEEALLTCFSRPIVLLKKKHPNVLSEYVSPRNKYFGTMLPYTPLHYLLLRKGFSALVMTSGNLSEEPIVIENEVAFERLFGIADYFLVHNRDIYLRSDDSIVRWTAGACRPLRRSRGYVPKPVFLKKKVQEVLACGAELKNTVCLTKEKQAFLSQHVGDLENLETYNFFEKTIEHMKKILDTDPKIIAYDMHPDYLSTRYAKNHEHLVQIPVQHHHAHIVSCMAENGLEGPVIGLAFDGTGYGTDNAIWGGEILFAQEEVFKRAAHLSYVPMPGGAAAIKEPWRMAVSYLYQTYGRNFWDLDLPVIKKQDPKKVAIICEMISKDVNCPKTSSLGRLFDGIASVLEIRDQVHYEGQAAMELEMLTSKDTGEYYRAQWIEEHPLLISVEPFIRGVVEDMRQGLNRSRIGGKFHLSLIRLFTDICLVLREESRLDRVVLSGGVFQNTILLCGLLQSLKEKGFQVFAHELVPSNDGGISLGQALVAASVMESSRGERWL